MASASPTIIGGSDIIPATALTLLAAMAGTMHWLARPHLFTILFAVIYTGQLRLFDRGELGTRPLFWRLVPLMVLWVNLHGAFFAGFVIIATFFAGNAIALATAPVAVTRAAEANSSASGGF